MATRVGTAKTAASDCNYSKHAPPLEEKVSLYTDNALLYLGDTDGFLKGTITKFGEFSGFTINRSKFILKLFDPLVLPLPAGATQIIIATFFKYLGVVMSPELRLN